MGYYSLDWRTRRTTVKLSMNLPSLKHHNFSRIISKLNIAPEESPGMYQKLLLNKLAKLLGNNFFLWTESRKINWSDFQWLCWKGVRFNWSINFFPGFMVPYKLPLPEFDMTTDKYSAHLCGDQLEEDSLKWKLFSESNLENMGSLFHIKKGFERIILVHFPQVLKSDTNLWSLNHCWRWNLKRMRLYPVPPWTWTSARTRTCAGVEPPDDDAGTKVITTGKVSVVWDFPKKSNCLSEWLISFRWTKEGLGYQKSNSFIRTINISSWIHDCCNIGLGSIRARLSQKNTRRIATSSKCKFTLEPEATLACRIPDWQRR